MQLDAFFSMNPVFTVKDVGRFLADRGSRSKWTRKALLAHHQMRGHILRVRRGLYAAVPAGVDPDACPIDPYLLAAKVTDDSVLAYHTALEFHGKAYSVYETFVYLTRRTPRPVRFRRYRFRAVLFPKPLRDKRQEGFGVTLAERIGIAVRVTSLERTLVDVLARPDLGGSWEEIWRSLESVEFFDLDEVVEYTVLLENATTAAKVGFFLEQHREALMVDDGHLQPLRERRPRKPHYLDRAGRRPGRLVKGWNLVVPVEIIERSWEETP